jgi:hypothetical protein
MAAVALIVRMLVGALFVAAGASKVGHFNDLAVVGPLAVILPFSFPRRADASARIA